MEGECKMKNPIKSYAFWLKIFSAALLIAFGIWLIVDINTGEKLSTFIVLMFTGAVAGIFALIRTIPLVKTLKTGKARIVCIIEIAVHIALAASMIFGAIAKISNEESKFADFIYSYYRFVIALFLYTRVVSYFICTVLFKEETDKIKFWVHIGIMTLTCVLCAIQFEGKTIAWVIAVLALTCSLGLSIEGGMGYTRYRKTIALEREIKKEEVEEVKEEDILPAEDSVIIPMIDENQDDSVHIN